ncbi:MAG: peptidylprolyl isomerase [Candidatus Diapherotrites archaeon]
MKKKIFAVAFLFLVLAGCSQPAENTNTSAGSGSPAVNAGGNQQSSGGDDAMKTVAKGDTVKVEYVGKFPGGEVFDKSEGRGPLEFTVGAGQMIAGFDEAVVGMKLNSEKTVTIPPEKAYGTLDPSLVVEVPLANIGGDGNVQIGSTLTAANGRQATVVGISDGNAKISFAHPLAGKTLEFRIKVVSIVKAK